MDKKALEQYLLQSLNMGLGSSIQGETSYTNSFDIKITAEGFIFIPRLPASYIIDDELYQKIFLIANASLYPRYTLLKQNSAFFIALDTDDIHVQRGLFFPWKLGISERIVIPDLEEFSENQKGNLIPIMKNLSIDYNKVTSMAIAGNSGSGKSYALTYFLTLLKNFSDLIIVDPKFDTPSRWARENGFPVLHPQRNRSKSDFVSEINEHLSSCLNLIHQRQEILYDNPDHKFRHFTVVIDEMLALSEGVNKTIRDSFFSLISEIALLSRSSNVHLCMVGQRFDHTSIPVSVREQLNVLIQIGNINKKTTQFLFPDLDPEGIVIPIGKGTGLIQIIDSDHPYQVLPLLCPTYFIFMSIVLNLALKQLRQLFEKLNIPQLKNTFSLIQEKLGIIEYMSKVTSIILITLIVFLITIELFQRFRSDSVFNYFKSIFQTIRFRHFLKQYEKTETVNDRDNNITKTQLDPVIQNFNSSISKCTIDVRNTTVSVVMQYPKTQQAQKILREMTEQIKEEISNYNPRYIFSSPTREGDKFWFKATKV